MSKANLHTGLSFWSEGSPSGLLGQQGLEAHIRQSILICLFTEKGERVFHPEFGSQISRFVFRSADSSLLQNLSREVRDCLEKFEPRIQLDEVYCEASELDRSEVTIQLKYRILETGSYQSLSIPLQV